MIERVLAPVDDPAQTRVAIDLAMALAAPLDATVTLFHVLDRRDEIDLGREEEEQRTDTGLFARPLDPTVSTGNPQIEDEDTAAAQPPPERGRGDMGALEAEPLPDEEAEAARHVLERIAAEHAESQVPVAVAIGTGNPADEIVTMAHVTPFDMVVMETRRQSALARMVMGSTADEVARRLQKPILLVNPRPSDEEHAAPVETPRNIVVPLNGSPVSEHVIPLAIELADGLSARLVFLHVQESPPEPAPVSGSGPGGRERGQQEQSGRVKEQPSAVYLEEFAGSARYQGLDARAEVVYGEPVAGITSFVQALDSPLVVLDASAKSGLHRLLTGSLPDKVIRKSGAPVLLAPEPLGPVIH